MDDYYKKLLEEHGKKFAKITGKPTDALCFKIFFQLMTRLKYDVDELEKTLNQAQLVQVKDVLDNVLHTMYLEFLEERASDELIRESFFDTLHMAVDDLLDDTRVGELH